jgi:hypothetical protein
MIGDVAGGEAQAANPPTRLAAPVILQTGAPGQGRVRPHQGHEQQAAMVVQLAVGDFSGGTGEDELGHGVVWIEFFARQTITRADIAGRIGAQIVIS